MCLLTPRFATVNAKRAAVTSEGLGRLLPQGNLRCKRLNDIAVQDSFSAAL